MKYTLNILALLVLSMLISCTPWANTQPTENQDNVSNPVVTEQDVTVSGETWSVVLELQNPHPLAGKTLNFDVVIENINKWEGNSQTDIVEVNDSIEVNYRGTLDDWEEFDSSYSRNETLPFTVGIGQMIAGFDAGVVGMQLGEEKTLVLTPEQAYGPATIREAVPTSELRTFVGPDFEIAIWATIETAWGIATIVELQD